MVKYGAALWSLVFGLSLLYQVDLETRSPRISTISDFSTPTFTRRQQEHLVCETTRAPSYYGFGVRLGAYFIWMQSLLANAMMPGEIGGALDKNSIFLFTLLVAMIKCSHIKMLLQIDGLILTHLSGGYIFGVLSIWGYRTCLYAEEGTKAIKHFGSFGTHFRLFLTLAISVYGWWFWKFGVKGSLFPMGPQNGNDPECGTLYTFMFAKVRADGGIRIFYLFFYTCCIIYFGIMFIVSGLVICLKFLKMVEHTKEKNWARSSRLEYATGFSRNQLTHLFAVLRWANILWMMYSVLLVELTLHYNHVNAVMGGPNSNELHLPTQIIALLIGAFGLVRLCYLKLLEWRYPPNLSESKEKFSQSLTSTQKLRFSWDVLTLFSPGFVTKEESPQEKPVADEAELNQQELIGCNADEIDLQVKGRSWYTRCWITWLPWLNVLLPPIKKPEEKESGLGEMALANNDENSDAKNARQSSWGLRESRTLSTDSTPETKSKIEDC